MDEMNNYYSPNDPTYDPPADPQYQQVDPVYQQPVYEQSYDQPAYQQPEYQQPAYQQPVYQQPAYPQQAYQQPVQAQYQQPRTVSNTAGSPVPSLIFGIIGAVCSWLGIIALLSITGKSAFEYTYSSTYSTFFSLCWTPIPGIIFSAIALAKSGNFAKANNGPTGASVTGRILGRVGLIQSIVVLAIIVISIIIIIIAIASVSHSFSYYY